MSKKYYHEIGTYSQAKKCIIFHCSINKNKNITMENESRNEIKKSAELNQKIAIIEKDIQPALYEQNIDKALVYAESEKDLNAKILKITLTINGQYPELSKYIEEMPETIPDDKNPEITLKNLNTYYDSLTAMLDKYILGHPVK